MKQYTYYKIYYDHKKLPPYWEKTEDVGIMIRTTEYDSFEVYNINRNCWEFQFRTFSEFIRKESRFLKTYVEMSEEEVNKLVLVSKLSK